MFEMDGVSEAAAAQAMELGAAKLSIRTRFVSRITQQGGDA